jgi:hypothetical protein
MTTLRDWAEMYLDELRVLLQQDPSVYVTHGGLAVQYIGDYLDTLRRRVRDTASYPNSSYDRQGELAAALICLGMQYPQQYSSLMQNVVGGGSIREFNGLSRLESVLNLLSDDHSYVLVRDASGESRLYLEGNLPKEYGFIPLTGTRELCETTCEILAKAGFDLEPSAQPNP